MQSLAIATFRLKGVRAGEVFRVWQRQRVGWLVLLSLLRSTPVALLRSVPTAVLQCAPVPIHKLELSRIVRRPNGLTLCWWRGCGTAVIPATYPYTCLHICLHTCLHTWQNTCLYTCVIPADKRTSNETQNNDHYEYAFEQTFLRTLFESVNLILVYKFRDKCSWERRLATAHPKPEPLAVAGGCCLDCHSWHHLLCACAAVGVL